MHEIDLGVIHGPFPMVGFLFFTRNWLDDGPPTAKQAFDAPPPPEADILASPALQGFIIDFLSEAFTHFLELYIWGPTSFETDYKSLYFNSDPHAKFWLVDQEIMEGFHTLYSFRDKEPNQRLKDLSPVITLSGSAVYARASQCDVYLQENWGKLGLDLLNAIEIVLKSTDLRSGRYYPNGSFLTAAMDVLVEIYPSRSPNEKEYAAVRVYGLLDTLKQVGHCLTWLTAAIRISPYGQMSYFDAILTNRSSLAPFSADPEIRNSMYFEIDKQELQPLSKKEQKMC
ncbi:hypothetical protein IFR05_002034 [Cadophora sp. M221]|nr:hypothetical protein IFR05_002034 [Cadophora sp. M221]